MLVYNCLGTHLSVLFSITAVKETEIEKQLKEEQKILESIAEKKGNIKWVFARKKHFSLFTVSL